MSSQFRGHRPATGQLSAPARPVRRESYPDISPQSSHIIATGWRYVHTSRCAEWPAWTDEIRYMLTLDPEGGTP